jgi:hypothetical protein
MATEFTANDGADAAPETQQCPNCGAVVRGEYCQECGQKKIHRHELSVKRFFINAANEFTDLESNKAFGTFTALLFKPGRLTDEYLAGRKGRYISPVKLYLTFSALYFLFAWGALSEARGGGVERMRQQPWAVSLAKARSVDVQTLVDKIRQRVEKYASVLRFASVLVSGLFLTALYYGTRKYYVEHLVFSLHYYSFDFFTKSAFGLLFILTGLVGWKAAGHVLNLFYPLALIYLMFALRRVYKESWGKTVAKSLLLFLCETAMFIAVNIIGFFVAIALA